MFQAVTKKGKVGHGEVESKPYINDDDMKIPSDYFQKNMRSRPNALNLQHIVLFNIIHYTGR